MGISSHGSPALITVINLQEINLNRSEAEVLEKSFLGGEPVMYKPKVTFRFLSQSACCYRWICSSVLSLGAHRCESVLCFIIEAQYLNINRTLKLTTTLLARCGCNWTKWTITGCCPWLLWSAEELPVQVLDYYRQTFLELECIILEVCSRPVSDLFLKDFRPLILTLQRHHATLWQVNAKIQVSLACNTLSLLKICPPHLTENVTF